MWYTLNKNDQYTQLTYNIAERSKKKIQAKLVILRSAMGLSKVEWVKGKWYH